MNESRDMMKILIIIFIECSLFFICTLFQPDIILSEDYKILNAEERIKAFKDAFSYTLPIHLVLIYLLFRGVKLNFSSKERLEASVLKDKAIAFAGTFVIILIYLSNSL